jgi:hypothetical protein
MDSSRLFLLARAAARADAPSGRSPLLLDMLRAHTCGGLRRIVMSVTCFDDECFGISSNGSTHLSDICSNYSYEEVKSTLEVRADGAYEGLPDRVRVGDRQLRFDRGERSLVHVLDEDDSVMVTNDEDAFDLIKKLAGDGVVSVYPIQSVSLLRSMYDCGALVAAEVALLCREVRDGVACLPGMSVDKVNRKIRQVDELLNHVALAEARTSYGRMGRPGDHG